MKRDPAGRFSFDAFSRRLTRRRIVGAALVAGVGAKLLTSSTLWPRAAQSAAPIFKGMCYDALPAPYNPSTANQGCIFFGSDVAYDDMKPLWNESFTSKSGQKYPGRNDLQALQAMGVTLLRLYDWEPRNYHKDFLDDCLSHGIHVLAPVSNYFLIPGQGFPNRDTLIPNLIRSYGNGVNNAGATDYHPAIAGLIFGNEPEISGFTVTQCIEFTKSWVNIEAAQFPGFRQVPIGHPVDFGLYGGQYPCWGFWDPLFAGLAGTTTRGLQSRLFLAPQPYNDANYLYQDVGGGANQGYVPLSFARYQKPLLFTEIGQDRTKPNYLTVIDGQIRGAIAYAAQNPGQLQGLCHFQYADKVWLCPTGGSCPSEGSFGVHSHTNSLLTTVNYVPADFTHVDAPHFSCNNQQLKVDVLTQNPSYAVVKAAYTSSGPTPTAKPTVTPTVGPTATPTPTPTPSPTPPAGGISAKVLSATSLGGGLYSAVLQITLGGALALNAALQVRISKTAYADAGTPTVANNPGCAPIPSPYFKDGSSSNNRYDLNIAGNACGAGSVITVTESVKGSSGTTFTQSVTSATLGVGTTPPFTIT